jgi:hypothetical protein
MKFSTLGKLIAPFLWGSVGMFFILISERTLYSFVKNIDYYQYGIIFISLIYFMIVIFSIRYLMKFNSYLIDIVIITIVASVLRIVSIIYINTQPVDDFLGYYNEALRVTTTKEIDISFSRFLNTPELFSYVLWEAMILTILGKEQFSIQITNTISCTIISLLIYLFLRKINRQTAIAGGLLFSLSPASLILTPVLTNQHSSLLFYLISFYLVTIENNTEKTYLPILKYFTSGILIGIGQLIRPDGIISLLSIISFLIIFNPQVNFIQENSKFSPKILKIAQSALLGLFLCIGFAIPINSYLLISKVDQERYQYLSTLNTYYKIWVGLNPQTRGTWNLEDALLHDDLKKNQTIDQSMPQIKIVLANRIKNLPSLLTLFSDKINILWVEKDFSFSWATQDTYSKEQKELIDSLPERKRNRIINDKEYWLENFERIFHTFDNVFRLIIYACAAFSIWVRKKTITRFELLFLIVTLLYAGVHLIIEVQTRYRYFLLPIIIMFASPVIASLGIKFLSIIYENFKHSD